MKRRLPLFLLLLPALLVGCATRPEFAPVDLSQADWQVHRGQAVWKFGREAPEIVGDLLVATRPGGEVFAQFSKTPLTVAVARAGVPGWELDLAMFQRRISGRGEPDDRFALFQLARQLEGRSLPSNWTWRPLEGERWRLANDRTGEFLEGFWQE